MGVLGRTVSTMLAMGLVTALASAAVLAPAPARAEFQTSSPARMVRSLEFVQDAVVQGDHSAVEMQRHLLGLIDERLRAGGAELFDDPANVDAAYIYTMSGGNPATLGILASGPAAEHFDPRLVDVLHDYLNGEGHEALPGMMELLPGYEDSRIRPYLTLVAANLNSGSEPETALHLFDWARLLAPGTIIEESALRRSIFVATREDMIERGLSYAERYARRFLHSPYAGQFADLFVDLVIRHPDAIEAEEIAAILGFMDIERQRSVYLRIARQAVIAGDQELAIVSAHRAETLASDNPKVRALAGLYAGVAGVPSADVVEAAEQLSAIDAADLSERDRALQRAARRIAEQVTRPPDPESLAVTAPPTAADAGSPAMDAAALADAPIEDLPEAPAQPVADEPAAAAPAVPDPIIDYVSSQRAVLETIDELLEEER